MIKMTVDDINRMIKECGGEGEIEYVNEFKKGKRIHLTLKHIPTGVEDTCRKDKLVIIHKIKGMLSSLTEEKINKIIEQCGMKDEVVIDGTFKKEGRLYIWLKHIPTGRRESCQKGEEAIKQKIRALKNEKPQKREKAINRKGNGWSIEKISIDEINSIDEDIVFDGGYKENGEKFIYLKHIPSGKKWSCHSSRREIMKKIRAIKRTPQVTIKEGVEGKVCSACNKWKPLEEFSIRKKMGKIRNECKSCRSERSKKYRLDNIERISEYDSVRHKEKYLKNKDVNLKEISEMLVKTKPFLKGLDAFGIIYKVTNVKTNRIYIGQTVTSLNVRYGANLIQGWIQDRLKKTNQKFKEELIDENDFIIDRIDVGVCQYHLNRLESFYINKYDSFYNGYNNNSGPHIDNEGIEEFNDILKKYNLKFEGNKLIEI